MVGRVESPWMTSMCVLMVVMAANYGELGLFASNAKVHLQGSGLQLARPFRWDLLTRDGMGRMAECQALRGKQPNQIAVATDCTVSNL